VFGEGGKAEPQRCNSEAHRVNCQSQFASAPDTSRNAGGNGAIISNLRLSLLRSLPLRRHVANTASVWIDHNDDDGR
ncbi:MAG: hypothetical protein ACKPKO_43070, partial [Candidatus Fonsibacter sp.]